MGRLRVIVVYKAAEAKSVRENMSNERVTLVLSKLLASLQRINISLVLNLLNGKIKNFHLSLFIRTYNCHFLLFAAARGYQC